MKISHAFCLAVLIITVTGQISARPTGEIQGDDLLLLDNGTTGQQNESAANVTESGIWEVVLERNDLVFEICAMKCNAEVLVCYDDNSLDQNSSNLCNSGCGFYLTVQRKIISITTSAFEYKGPTKESCESLRMKNGQFFFRGAPFFGCTPKIENGMVKLNVTKASSDCPLFIKDAYVLPETTTLPPTTTMYPTLGHNFSTTAKGGVSGAGNGATTEEPSFMDNYWWILLIIVIVVIIAGIVAGVLIYYFKCKKGKNQQAGHLAAPGELPGQQPPPAPNGSRPPLPPSVMNPPSILSRKSLLDINRE